QTPPGPAREQYANTPKNSGAAAPQATTRKRFGIIAKWHFYTGSVPDGLLVAQGGKRFSGALGISPKSHETINEALWLCLDCAEHKSYSTPNASNTFPGMPPVRG